MRDKIGASLKDSLAQGLLIHSNGELRNPQLEGRIRAFLKSQMIGPSVLHLRRRFLEWNPMSKGDRSLVGIDEASAVRATLQVLL